MILTGSCGYINGVKQQMIRQVGASECDGWPYEWSGHIKGSFI